MRTDSPQWALQKWCQAYHQHGAGSLKRLPRLATSNSSVTKHYPLSFPKLCSHLHEEMGGFQLQSISEIHACLRTVITFQSETCKCKWVLSNVCHSDFHRDLSPRENYVSIVSRWILESHLQLGMENPWETVQWDKRDGSTFMFSLNHCGTLKYATVTQVWLAYFKQLGRETARLTLIGCPFVKETSVYLLEPTAQAVLSDVTIAA